MTGKQLERHLATFTPYGGTHLDHTARALRGASLLPLGGRGIQAPKVTPQHVANMLIGVGAADAPQQAPSLVPLYFGLPASWSGDFKDGEAGKPRPFHGFATFGEALTGLLEDADYAMQVEEVLINRSWPRAIIRGKEQTGFYGYAGHVEAREAGYRTSPCALMFHYSAGTIHQLAIDLSGINDVAGIDDIEGEFERR